MRCLRAVLAAGLLLAAAGPVLANGMAALGATVGILLVYGLLLIPLVVAVGACQAYGYRAVAGLEARAALRVAAVEGLLFAVLAWAALVPISCDLGWHVGYEKDFGDHLQGMSHDPVPYDTALTATNPMGWIAVWAAAIVALRCAVVLVACLRSPRRRPLLPVAILSALVTQALATALLVAVCLRVG